jgi:hypothetical protein
VSKLSWSWGSALSADMDLAKAAYCIVALESNQNMVQFNKLRNLAKFEKTQTKVSNTKRTKTLLQIFNTQFPKNPQSRDFSMFHDCGKMAPWN